MAIDLFIVYESYWKINLFINYKYYHMTYIGKTKHTSERGLLPNAQSKLYLACENSRLSSLLAAGDVSLGEKRPQRRGASQEKKAVFAGSMEFANWIQKLKDVVNLGNFCIC